MMKGLVSKLNTDVVMLVLAGVLSVGFMVTNKSVSKEQMKEVIKRGDILK